MTLPPHHSDDGEKVARYWGDEDFTRNLAAIHWMASAVVRGYLNRLASGSETLDWLTYLSHRHLQPRRHRVLVIGCGEGWLERAIASNPNVERIDAYDIAPEAVARAAELAAAAGLTNINYGVLDLNHQSLPREEYELVIAHSVLHHIENLEHAFPQIEQTLTRDGVLFVNEYVGPMRFQYTDRQMTILNGLLGRLPERFRRSAVSGAIYDAKTRPTIEEMIRTDPSEAVRSDELMPFLESHFEIRESIRYGGTILNHLLYDIVQNFRDDQEPDQTMLQLLCLTEELLIHEGGLASDYQLVVATRKGHGAAVSPASAATPTSPSIPAAPGLPLMLASKAGGSMFGLRGRRRQSDLRGAGHPVVMRHLEALSWNDTIERELSGRTGLHALVLGERQGEWSGWLAARPEIARVDVALAPRGSNASSKVVRVSADRIAPASYDLALSIGALSMAPDLMSPLSGSMRSGAVLYAEEYVGLPMRRIRRGTEAVLARLLGILGGAPARSLSRRLRDHALQIATGGTPQASALPSLFTSHFDDVDITPVTSLLLQELLALRPDLLASPADDAGVLDLVCGLEKWLMVGGVIPADFVTIRAVKG